MPGRLSTALDGRELNRRISHFNLSWSAGVIVGPLVAGFLAQWRLEAPIIAGTVLIGIVGVAVLFASIFLSEIRADAHRARARRGVQDRTTGQGRDSSCVAVPKPVVYLCASMLYEKGIPRILAFFFGVLFLISLVTSIFTISSLPRFFEAQNAEAPTPEYHFSVFLPNTASLFFSEVAAGARSSANENGVALSFHPIGTDTLDFRMARFSGIDGAIVYSAVDEALARRTLEQLDSAGIPVVLIEHGGPGNDPPLPFVGTNNFDLGRRIGELIAETSDGEVNLTIVYSDKSPGVFSEKELVELGVTTVLADRLAGPISRRTTGLNPLDAKSVTNHILRTEPRMTHLVLTDTNDTLAAVQIVVDLNLVGTVQIIGFGSGEDIEDYLRRGILAGTVVVNPRRIGYNAVRVLAGLRRDGYSAGYVDTGVEVLRRPR